MKILSFFLDYPLDNGKTWTSDDWSFEVIGDEDLDVKAGSFGCKKVKMKVDNMTQYLWYSDGVGIVRSSMVDTMVIDTIKTIMEHDQKLDDYTVK